MMVGIRRGQVLQDGLAELNILAGILGKEEQRKGHYGFLKLGLRVII